MIDRFATPNKSGSAYAIFNESLIRDNHDFADGDNPTTTPGNRQVTERTLISPLLGSEVPLSSEVTSFFENEEWYVCSGSSHSRFRYLAWI